MHILFVNTGGGAGGIETYLLGACRFLTQSGHSVTLAAPGDGGLLKQALDTGARPFPISLSSKFDFRSILSLRAYLEQNPVDVVDAQQERTLLIALAARACMVRGKRPLVLQTEHNRTIDRLQCDEAAREMKKSTLAFHRLLCRYTEGFVCVSDAVRKFLIEAESVVPERAITVPVGVDPATMHSVIPRDEARRRYGLSPHSVVLTSVAKFKLQKDIETLLRAFSLVVQTVPTVELALAGEGPEFQRMRELAVSLGVSNNTHFLGFRDDIADLLVATDVFVLTSRWEGMPKVVLEAMAVKKPVVGTAVSGTPELIVDGVTGFLVPPRDPQETCDALLKLIMDEQMRRSIGENGYRRVLEKFQERNMIAQLAQAFETFVGNERRVKSES